MSISNKFWMVFIDTGTGSSSAPTRKHADVESARKEAARLATKASLGHAYVLEAIDVVEPEYPAKVTPLVPYEPLAEKKP